MSFFSPTFHMTLYIDWSRIFPCEASFKYAQAVMKVFALCDNTPSSIDELSIALKKVIKTDEGILRFIHKWETFANKFTEDFSHTDDSCQCIIQGSHRVCVAIHENNDRKTKKFWINPSFAAYIFPMYPIIERKQTHMYKPKSKMDRRCIQLLDSRFDKL